MVLPCPFLVLICLYSWIMAQGSQITWLDYIIMQNPSGIMKVLSDHGYTGYLLPQNEQEMKDASLDLMDQFGDNGVIALLKAHPEYPVLLDLAGKKSRYNNFTGIMPKVESFVSKLTPIDQIFVALGVFMVTHYLLSQFKES